MKGKLASSQGDELLAQAVDVNGIKVLAARLEGADAKTLRDTMDKLKDKLKTAAIVLAAVDGNKVQIAAGVTADSTAKVVIAAGRLVPVKRYDLLIEAFAQVAAVHPDWQLRIYGKGEEQPRLRELIERLGLWNNVFLMGAATPMEAEWAKGSIGAAASNFEPFGMTIVEAMRCGLPVVSTDCPYGPGEIIQDGTDGRLVPVGDRDALGAALLELVGDDERRRRMSRAALDNACRFAPGPVVAQAERLLEAAAAARDTGRGATAQGHRTRDALAGRSHAARDAAHAAASGVLRSIRKGRR